MSLVEVECRLSIAVAYAAWLWSYASETHFRDFAAHQAFAFNILDYERALGLHPPFDERET